MPPRPHATGLALQGGPRELTPPPWGAASIGYERLVQPVLDRHCGACHTGEGKGRARLDLTLRPGQGVFKEPYLTLIGSIGHGLNRRPITTIMLCVVVVLLMVSFGHYMGFDRCYFDESRCV